MTREPRRDRPEPEAPLVYGLHPVVEWLELRPLEVERVLVARERQAAVGRVLRLARDAGVPVSRLPRTALSRRVGARANHQGVAARVAGAPYTELQVVSSRALADPEGLLVLLDRVEDPQNLGAILRGSAGAGALGVLLGGEGTVGLSPAVGKASAGAWLRVPVAREPQPARRIESLCEQGYRAVALDPRAETPWDRLDLTGRIIIVAGGERRGCRQSVSRACTARVGIPLAGGLESLNVATAVNVLLFEAVRQRRVGKSGS